MDSSNIILQLPFDEQAGSSVAYDYSQSRADGVVNGATFAKGRNGNAIVFSGDDTCEISESPFNLVNNFTIISWVNPARVECGSPSKLIWVAAFTGENNYIELPVEVKPESWYSIAFVRSGSHYLLYVNASLIAEVVNNGSLQGVSLCQDYYGGEYGKGMLDDVVIYRSALSQQEIIEALSNSKEQAYTIDGIDLKYFGVYVSGSDGILNRPARKTPYSVSFDNYHGSMVDLNHNYVGDRTITLSCFMKANGKMDFIQKVAEFEQMFDKRGTIRLVVDVHPVKPLIYEVYMKDSIEIVKTWSDELMVGTFKLKLVEPEPVKRILKHIRVSDATRTCEITIKSKKYLNIYWGDGAADYDVAGQDDAVTISHEYVNNGDYFPVITGCIDDIIEFSTNAIVVWNKL